MTFLSLMLWTISTTLSQVAPKQKLKQPVVNCAKAYQMLTGLGCSPVKDSELNLTLDTTTCGCHRQCYMKFTDVSKISRAISKLTQSVEDLPAKTDTAQILETSHNDQSESMDQGPAPKLLRSVHTLHCGHIVSPVVILFKTFKFAILHERPLDGKLPFLNSCKFS
ncbi:uncharacterized protein [Apostichopus japonicus]|uniref:uncharacterized protein n=1 Tax=Stichopus japonicus TaxID=307972 RepID=UPI003AB8492F